MEHLPAGELEFLVPVFAGCLLAFLLLRFFLHRWRRATEERLRIEWQNKRDRLLSLMNSETPSIEQRKEAETLIVAIQAEESRILVDRPLVAALIRGKLLSGDFSKAEKLIKSAAQQHPDTPVQWQDLGIDLLVARKASDPQAIERLQEACIRNPARESWGKRLLSLLTTGTPLSRTAGQAVWTYYEAHHDPRALQYLGDSYEKKKLFSRESLPIFQALADAEKKKVKWQYALARCLYESGDQAGAGQALKLALSLDSSYQPAIEFSQRLTQQRSPVPRDGAASPAPQTPVDTAVSDKGSSLPPRYVQVVEIGRGGMGTVYRAFDDVLAREVAIKTLNEAIAGSDPELRERFLGESRILAALDHPSIPKVFDVSVNPPIFIAFEFIRGENLRSLLEPGPLAIETALNIGGEVAEGLHHVIERGVLHRDIKPENILIDISGHSRIVDFGLAHGAMKTQQTQTGVVVGTPWYLAPERLRGQPATPASEIFAFGVMLFEMICGQRPFTGDDVTVILAQDPPRPCSLRPDCPPRLEVLMLDCISKNPNNRPPDFKEIKAELTATIKEISG
ncbi:protein kinase [Candidatus Ozemobacteraceae bacterium]|nr:protein kinase [Candidatus Ozemobacteraceae bacterium]